MINKGLYFFAGVAPDAFRHAQLGPVNGVIHQEHLDIMAFFPGDHGKLEGPGGPSGQGFFHQTFIKW